MQGGCVAHEPLIHKFHLQKPKGLSISVPKDRKTTGANEQPVPHIEQLSSRLLLLSLLPSLSTFANPLTPTPAPLPSHRRTVLDVGAGIGRVSRQVLAPLFDDVVLLEPVDKFVRQGYTSASNGEWASLRPRGKAADGEGKEKGKGTGKGGEGGEGGKKDRGTRVWFVKAGLQGCEPRHPAAHGETVGVVGENLAGDAQPGFAADGEVEYDA